MATPAVVTAHQTAFFLNESLDAEKSEYRIRGDIIFVHGSYNTSAGTHDDLPFEQERFYKSIDRQGRLVYVRAADIQIYFDDSRELDFLD